MDKALEPVFNKILIGSVGTWFSCPRLSYSLRSAMQLARPQPVPPWSRLCHVAGGVPLPRNHSGGGSASTPAHAVAPCMFALVKRLVGARRGGLQVFGAVHLRYTEGERDTHGGTLADFQWRL